MVPPLQPLNWQRFDSLVVDREGISRRNITLSGYTDHRWTLGIRLSYPRAKWLPFVRV